MGTNYYLYEKPACECCGHRDEPLHIGKSSGGWCFSLHVIPENGIKSLVDWISLWSKEGVIIEDEYGKKVSNEEMLDVITNRVWRGQFPMRHDIDDYRCVGHGEGTWDLITGEFC